MYFKQVFTLILLFSIVILHGKAQQQDFNRATFYKVLSAENEASIDAQINNVRKSGLVEMIAYEGVLLMKKSGMVAKPKEKIKLFKSGRTKLETAIAGEKDNIEYRFLRVIIQEHAPKIVKYRNELEEDCKFIRANFSRLSPFLQQVIIDYSKKSKILKIPTHN